MKKYQHLRCPCCGKLSRARNFNPSVLHAVEIMEQEIGGDRHIAWSRKTVTREVVYMMYLRVKSVCKMLEGVLRLDSAPISSVRVAGIRIKPAEVWLDGKKI